MRLLIGLISNMMLEAHNLQIKKRKNTKHCDSIIGSRLETAHKKQERNSNESPSDLPAIPK